MKVTVLLLVLGVCLLGSVEGSGLYGGTGCAACTVFARMFQLAIFKPDEFDFFFFFFFFWIFLVGSVMGVDSLCVMRNFFFSFLFCLFVCS